MPPSGTALRLVVAAFVALLVSPLVAAQPGPGGRPGGAPSGGAVTGRALDDATGEPIPLATVAVYNRAAADSAFVTGVAAGEDGAFAVEGLRPGAYTVRVSSVGYGPQNVRADVGPAPVALGDVRLAPEAALLGEAEVAARRELVEQRADRTIYNVADQPVTAGGSAIEALQTLPSVEVDAEGNLSLRGNQNVAVHLNGRPVPVRGAFLAALLRQIPASQVQRVEVIPNPSARYEPDGMSGIINIVLKENVDRGLSGGLTLGGGTSPNAEVGGNLAYQRGPLDASATYGFRYDQFGIAGSSRRQNLTLGTDTNQLSDEGREGLSHFLSTSVDYQLAQGSNLTFEGTLGVRGSAEDETISYFDAFGDADPATQRLTEGDDNGLNGDAALVFRRRFDGGTPTAPAAGARPAAGPRMGGGPGGGGPGGGGGMMGGGGGRGGSSGGAGVSGDHELAVEARVTRNVSDDLEQFRDFVTGTADPLALAQVNSDEQNDEAYLQADYARPLGGALDGVRLEVGAKGTLRRVDSDLLYEDEVGGAWVTDEGRTNAFVYDEQVGAAYVQASRALGPFQALLGLRAETASREFTLDAAPLVLPGVPAYDPDSTAFRYASLFPSAFLTLPLGPGTLVKGSYSRRINRPRSGALNPFPSYEDTLNVRVGNPQLRPEYTDSFELTLQYKYFFTLTPFYRHTTDVIRQRLLFDDETGVSTFTSQNLDTQDSYGADLTLMAQLGPVRGFVSGSVARTVTDGGSIETGLASDALSYSARASVQARIREGTDVQVFGFYRAPQEVEDGRISGFGIATLGVSQRITPALSLSARVNDLFSTTKFEWNRSGETFLLNGLRDPDTQQISATLTYTFGQAPQRRQRQPQEGEQPQEGGFGL